MEDEFELLKAMFTEEELTITPPSSLSLTTTGGGARSSPLLLPLPPPSTHGMTLVTFRLTGTGTSITVHIHLPSDYPNTAPIVTFERARIADEVQLMKEVQFLITDRCSNGMICIYEIIELVRTALQTPLTCFICFEPVEDDTGYTATNNKEKISATVLPVCGHVLHTACLAPWFWRSIENARKSASHTVILQREKQEKSALKNIVERAENNVQQNKIRCQTLENEIETMNKQLASVKILAAHSASVQQQANQQNRKRESNRKNKGTGPMESDDPGTMDNGVLTVADITKIINELQTELKTTQRNLHSSLTKLESAVKTAQENNVHIPKETLMLLNNNGAGITGTSSSTTNVGETLVKPGSSVDADILQHLELCKNGLAKDTTGGNSNNDVGTTTTTFEPLLKCPVCRTIITYSNTIHQWYEPWLVKEHKNYRSKDTQNEIEKQNNTDVVSPPPIIDLHRIRISSTSSSTNNNISSNSSVSSLPTSIRIPSEITDPFLRGSLEKFALQWYKGYQHAIDIGGIIGTSTPLPITIPSSPVSLLSSPTSSTSTLPNNHTDNKSNRPKNSTPTTTFNKK